MRVRKKKKIAKRDYQTIRVNGRFVIGRRAHSGLIVTDDGRMFVFRERDGKWHQFNSILDRPVVRGRKEDLGKFETIGTDTYQYQYKDDEIQLVLVQKEVKVISLAYVPNAGIKARTAGR